MGMKEPFICEIAKDTYAVNEFGMDALYLCVGSKRALLIDTGVGSLDLKALVRKLTEKPYDVVLTHGHVDHAGGIDCFEKIFMHEKDRDAAFHLTRERRREYASVMKNSDIHHAYDFSLESIREWENLPLAETVSEGFQFDLGDRILEVIETPGHTPGSVSLLDRKERILFSGDACNVNTICRGGCSIETLLRTARKIIGLEDQFDRDFNGHIGYAGMPVCFSQPAGVHRDIAEICARIMAGKAEVTKESFLGGFSYGASLGTGRVVYDENTPIFDNQAK